LFALPLSGAGLTFFAAAKKVSKESSFPTPMLASRRQTVMSEWSNRGSVVSGVSSLLACRKGAHVAPRYGVDQQSYIRPGTSCPTTGLPAVVNRSMRREGRWMMMSQWGFGFA
ncbi:hypothetical protein, partial [Caballeronia choica]|uniref:hypothetical protein n=1 Tax=Caballeronia choica TaxID=326476 RepID=UPI0011773E3E